MKRFASAVLSVFTFGLLLMLLGIHAIFAPHAARLPRRRP
jgi:hypothetical protein